MGINPIKFGPYFWGSLHLACLGGIDPNALKALVGLYPAVLPCPACGMHFLEVLQTNPLPESSDPIVLFKWSVDVHNVVNQRIGKPLQSYDEAYSFWTTLPTPETQKIDVDIVLAVVILLALVYFLISRLL